MTSNAIGDAIREAFLREHDGEVTFSQYSDPLELENELLSSRSSCDVIVANSALVSRWLSMRAFEPIDLSGIRGWDRIDPRFLSMLSSSPANSTAPIAVRYDGIGYRGDKLEVPPDGSAIFLDGRYRKKMVMRDDARSVLGALLRLRGASRNSGDARVLEVARQDAIAAKRNLRGFESESPIPLLVDGDVWVAQASRGEVMRARSTQSALEWAMPKEGGAIEILVVAVPRRGRNSNLARAFVEFLLRPEINASLARASLDGTPHRDARQILLTEGSEAAFEPSDGQFGLLEVASDLGRDQVIWDRIWSDVQTSTNR